MRVVIGHPHQSLTGVLVRFQFCLLSELIGFVDQIGTVDHDSSPCLAVADQLTRHAFPKFVKAGCCGGTRTSQNEPWGATSGPSDGSSRHEGVRWLREFAPQTTASRPQALPQTTFHR